MKYVLWVPPFSVRVFGTRKPVVTSIAFYVGTLVLVQPKCALLLTTGRDGVEGKCGGNTHCNCVFYMPVLGNPETSPTSNRCKL